MLHGGPKLTSCLPLCVLRRNVADLHSISRSEPETKRPHLRRIDDDDVLVSLRVIWFVGNFGEGFHHFDEDGSQVITSLGCRSLAVCDVW